MELVINVCYGVFSLSPLGQSEYLKRKGKQAFFYKQTKYSFDDGKNEYERIDNIDNPDNSLNTVTKNLGKIISGAFPNNDTFFGDEIERNDPDLIAVVKEFGEKASGQRAKLSVVEIPNEIEWEINEYDGNETVEEKHRSWR